MMKNYTYRKRMRALMALTLAGGLLVNAADGRLLAPLYRVNATEAPAGEEGSGEEDDTDAGSTIMKQGLGNVTFYRWQKGGPYTSTTEWTRCLMINDCYTSDYVAAKIPDSIFFDPFFHTMSSLPRSDRNSDSPTDIINYRGSGWSAGKSTLDAMYRKNNNNIRLADCDLVFIPDRANNYPAKDPMIRRDRDVFFTDDARDTPYVKYYGDNKYNIVFADDLEHNPNATKYYLEIGAYSTGEPGGEDDPDEDDANRGYIRVNPDYENRAGESAMEFKGGVPCQSNSEYRLSMTNGCLHGCYVRWNWKEDYSHTSFTRWLGQEMHFSTLEQETTVTKKNVFNVSAGDYVDAKGETHTTQGVMIQNGGKLTIDGGVVSVKGTLINNGTIEIKNGGVLLVQDGASVSSFLQGKDISKNGCGKILCTDGDIIIEKGGAIYAGMCDGNTKSVPFSLSNNSTLVNCGLLVYGAMTMGNGTRVECREGSKTIGGIYPIASGKFDGDYDILGNYTKSIMNTDGAVIPTSCKGLNDNSSLSGSGIQASGGAGKVTILKYEGASFHDTTAENQKLVTEYKGL